MVAVSVMVVSGVWEGKRVKVGVSVPDFVGVAEMERVVEGVKGERVAEIVRVVVGVPEGGRDTEAVGVLTAVCVGETVGTSVPVGVRPPTGGVPVLLAEAALVRVGVRDKETVVEGVSRGVGTAVRVPEGVWVGVGATELT